MWQVVSQLSLPEQRLNKPRHLWSVVPGNAADVYAAGTPCALREAAGCAEVATQRGRTAFLANLVGNKAQRPEWIALAPDWLFGRGCLSHVKCARTRLPYQEGFHLRKAITCEEGCGQAQVTPSVALMICPHAV